MSSRISIDGLLAVVLIVLSGAAPVARGTVAEVAICFNYGCHDRQKIEVASDDLAPFRARFDHVASAEDEREAIRAAVAGLYTVAGRQSPIWRDRGGNFADDDTKHGRMDCIDHSANTTAFLRLIDRIGWLRHHAVGEPAVRGRVFNVHWSATMTERATGVIFAVDSWFFDPGELPVIYTLKEWLAGRRPPGTSVLSNEWMHRWRP